MSRIVSVPLSFVALVQIATSLRQRSERLHHLADDAGGRVYRERANEVGRLAKHFDELVSEEKRRA